MKVREILRTGRFLNFHFDHHRLMVLLLHVHTVDGQNPAPVDR